MPDHHPVTLIVGALLTIFIALLVFFGLACSAYTMDPVENSWAKSFNEIAISYKMCK